MALFPIHEYFIFNGNLKPTSEFVPSENDGGIYEVLRVVKGVPLFLEEHLQRFYQSAQIANKKIVFSEKEIRSFLDQVIQRNHIPDGNVLISCKTNLKIFFIAHSYPSNGFYKRGVTCGLLKAERKNPNAKVFQTPVRQKANEMIAAKGFQEVILVDGYDRITEGSRSNLFFIKESNLITSPGNEVLLGITRQKIIDLAKKLKFNIQEKDIFLKDLTSFDAIFITGTSPKILPVRQVDEMNFDPGNYIVQRLITEYNILIDEYIKTR